MQVTGRVHDEAKEIHFFHKKPFISANLKEMPALKMTSTTFFITALLVGEIMTEKDLDLLQKFADDQFIDFVETHENRG